jgi:hypothetical protein
VKQKRGGRRALPYWARLQYGQKPERIALPENMDSRLENITIVPSEPQQRITLTSEQEEQIPAIDVAVDGLINHVFARRIQRNITRTNLDERGMLLARSGAIVPVKASPTGLPRALRILDALFELPGELKEELEKMVEWGLRHANYLDPLTDLKWVAQQFKNPPWLFGY